MQIEMRKPGRVCRFAAVVYLLSWPCAALAQTPAAQPPTAPNYSQEAVVVEEARTRYRFEKDGTGQREMYMRLRTQSEAGAAVGQILFGYNSANERPRSPSCGSASRMGVDPTLGDAVRSKGRCSARPIYTDFRQKHIIVKACGWRHAGVRRRRRSTPPWHPAVLMEHEFQTRGNRPQRTARDRRPGSQRSRSRPSLD